MCSKKLNITDVFDRKGKQKISMVTCYDASFAAVIDETDIDIILVGDSLANVVLGMEKTKDVSFEEMLNHTRAVKKSVSRTIVIADMPYVSYQKDGKKAVYYARKFLEDAGADAVKIEWFEKCPEVTKLLIENKIPVMGHIGLTPQTADELGGFHVQAKSAQKAFAALKQAELFEELGVFSIVIECVPARVSKVITERLKIPTIGIGAGNSCDGQVLVLYDMLGLYKKIQPKFVRAYLDLSSIIRESMNRFSTDVKEGNFPCLKESFSIKDEEFDNFIKFLK